MWESQDESGQGFLQPPKWVLWFKYMSVALFFFFFEIPLLLLLPIELLVEQENEQVDVNGGLVEELHHRHSFILQLEEILRNKAKLSLPT